MENNRLWPEGPWFRQANNLKLTTDALLLADFAQIGNARCGADLGCGSGILMMLLLWENPQLCMTGFEMNPDALETAAFNFNINSLKERSTLVEGDLRETAAAAGAGSYDFIIMNPPYFTSSAGGISPNADRASARGETAGTLEDFCAAAALLCRSGGSCFLCFRPERMAELFEFLRRCRLEPKRMRLVHHTAEKTASLLLLECGRNGRPGLMAEAPLILMDRDGQESTEYRRIYHR